MYSWQPLHQTNRLWSAAKALGAVRFSFQLNLQEINDSVATIKREGGDKSGGAHSVASHSVFKGSGNFGRYWELQPPSSML